MAADGSPDRLMLATAADATSGRVSRSLVTHSTPAMTREVGAVPLQLRTLTEVTGAPGATPTTAVELSIAAAMPATCVPCPLQSKFLPSLTKFWECLRLR